jgi:hypothetical protein
MTPEEYINTICDTIHTNNRIVRENQILQSRLLTILENGSNISQNNANTPNTPNTTNTTNATTTNLPQTTIRQNRRNNPSRIIQDYVFSYIFEPYTTTEQQRQIPSTHQIHQSTDIIIYDISNIEFTTHVCPITLTHFINGENLLRIKYCRHIFKESSLLNWFSRNAHCPLCRYDITSYVTEENEDSEINRNNIENIIPRETLINEQMESTFNTSNISPIINNISQGFSDEIIDIITHFMNNTNYRR